MPIVTEEKAPERRKRGGRGLWLLLMAPFVAVLLLAAAAIHPLQLGPYLLTVRADRMPGVGWRTIQLNSRPPTSPAPPVRYRGHDYVITGASHGLALGAGDWYSSVILVQAHRR